MNWKENLKSQNLSPVQLDADMAQFTTYKAGGKAEVLALPENEAQLISILLFAKKNNIEFRVLGLGSNVLVSDNGIRGITCCLKNISGVQISENLVEALAGTPLDKVVAEAVNAGLEGIEDLSGIPGSVGGAVYMNAGAFKQETFNRIKDFKVLTPDGDITTIARESVTPMYRKVDGIEGFIIISARWELKTTDRQQLLDRRIEILQRRADKQPLDYPSAGSVFKRPADDYASRLIDESGLKGLKVGGAEVSPKHAGFIINKDNATASDIKNLIEEVRQKVKAKTGVTLETEQLMWGDF